MTNDELEKAKKAYVKNLTASNDMLGVWAVKDYIESRRKGESVTPVSQHDFNSDLWIMRHKDGTSGIYINTELARNSNAE